MFRKALIFLFFFPLTNVVAQDLNNPFYGPTLQQRQMQEWRDAGGAEIGDDPSRAVRGTWREQDYYGALAVRTRGGGHIGWAAGYLSSRFAKEQALKQCGEGCEVIHVFANTCAMMAERKGNDDASLNFDAVDSSPRRAIDKAYGACERKHGSGNCVYTQRSKSAKHEAFCTGYAYGIYSNR